MIKIGDHVYLEAFPLHRNIPAEKVKIMATFLEGVTKYAVIRKSASFDVVSIERLKEIERCNSIAGSTGPFIVRCVEDKGHGGRHHAKLTNSFAKERGEYELYWDNSVEDYG